MGRPRKWSSGETKAIRVPAALADRLLAQAAALDQPAPTNCDWQALEEQFLEWAERDGWLATDGKRGLLINAISKKLLEYQE